MKLFIFYKYLNVEFFALFKYYTRIFYTISSYSFVFSLFSEFLIKKQMYIFVPFVTKESLDIFVPEEASFFFEVKD